MVVDFQALGGHIKLSLTTRRVQPIWGGQCLQVKNPLPPSGYFWESAADANHLALFPPLFTRLHLTFRVLNGSLPYPHVFNQPPIKSVVRVMNLVQQLSPLLPSDTHQRNFPIQTTQIKDGDRLQSPDV